MPGEVQLEVEVVVVPPVGVVTGGVTQMVGAQVEVVTVPLVVGEHVVPGEAQVGVKQMVEAQMVEVKGKV